MVLDLVGTGLLLAGLVWEPLLIVVGLALALFGWLLLGLLFHGERLKRRAPGRYPGWIWWVTLIASVAGIALFAIPLSMALIVLRMLGLREYYWLGALFTALGGLVLAATAYAAIQAIRRRSRDWRRHGPPDPE